MLEMQIVDKSFAHDAGTVAGVIPKYVKWSRQALNKSRPVFFCNDSLNDLTYQQWGGEVYGLLFESPAILPATYDLVPTFIDKLTYLFTPNAELLRAYPEKARFVPAGGVWNSVLLNSNGLDIPEKNFIVSMLSSSKMMCGLHQFRLNLANILKRNNELSGHVYIQNTGEYINPSETLNHYYYSIVIENHISENYFTEKILNCFATGTIPIYFGAKHIDYFFDGSAILKFHSIETLSKILPMLSISDWKNRISGIENNMKSAKQMYRCIEDYLYINYASQLKV
ncbi:Glycosyl transferase family 10 [Oxalobacteraceae bacterium]